MCSHSPSVFSPSDCSILSCWRLPETPLDCSGEWPQSCHTTLCELISSSHLCSCADRVLLYESSRCFNNTFEFRGSPSAECMGSIFWKGTFSFYVRRFITPSFKGDGVKSMSCLQTIQSHGDRSNFNYIKRSREKNIEGGSVWSLAWSFLEQADPEEAFQSQLSVGWPTKTCPTAQWWWQRCEHNPFPYCWLCLVGSGFIKAFSTGVTHGDTEENCKGRDSLLPVFSAITITKSCQISQNFLDLVLFPRGM